MKNYRNEWLHACFSSENVKTATVYINGNEKFATYSIDIAFEAAKEVKGAVVDDDTGEILFEYDC